MGDSQKRKHVISWTYIFPEMALGYRKSRPNMHCRESTFALKQDTPNQTKIKHQSINFLNYSRRCRGLESVEGICASTPLDWCQRTCSKCNALTPMSCMICQAAVTLASCTYALAVDRTFSSSRLQKCPSPLGAGREEPPTPWLALLLLQSLRRLAATSSKIKSSDVLDDEELIPRLRHIQPLSTKR